MKLKSFSPSPARAIYLLLSCLWFITSPAVSQGITEQAINLRPITQLPSRLVESSGIAVSGNNRIWSHEDSGNQNELYCFDTTGTLLRTLTIANAVNTDWEDVAADDDHTWFVGNFGNNNNTRTDLTIYVIPDPETIQDQTVEAGIIRFNLEDQHEFPPPASNRNFDIEAMIWHGDSLYLFTKDRSNPFTGITKIYVIPGEPGIYTARLRGSLFAGSTAASGRITAADINHHSGELMLLTNEKIIAFRDYPGRRFFEGSRTDYVFGTPPGQNEGLAFVSNNKLYMTEEGNGSTTGYLYEIKLPQPQHIKEHKHRSILMIYPNPASDKLGLSKVPDGQVCIFSLQGKLEICDTPLNQALDISGLLPGAYLLWAEIKGKPARCVFIKN